MPASLRYVLKLDDIKLFQCPLSLITDKTWRLLMLVDECTNADGDLVRLPKPGGLDDQDDNFRIAWRIVRDERRKARLKALEK